MTCTLDAHLILPSGTWQGALKLAMDQDQEVRLAAVRVLAKVAPTQDRESADVLLHLVLTDMNEGAHVQPRKHRVLVDHCYP